MKEGRQAGRKSFYFLALHCTSYDFFICGRSQVVGGWKEKKDVLRICSKP
jgi:hypothetical protein